jgi:glycosyltransferase involved in cell wall biosynthesis
VAAESTRPRFTVVSAVYDVAAYLADFIASVERQQFDLSRVEVVMVDDGSTDGSAELLDAWAKRRPDLVRVLHQENAGQGAARNAGLEVARGEWVTFPDPDDTLGPAYLASVDAFLVEHPETVMVATHRLIWSEVTDAVTNSHPLRRLFTYDRMADLDMAESSFHGSAPAAFFDLERLRRDDVRFDVRIRPNFEDGHFCSSYLLHCERPTVGFVKSARYRYRKRADQSSSLQGSMRDPRRYTDVFEHGYLDVLDQAERLRGEIPLWLQHFLCYELLGYLVAHDVSGMPVLTSADALESFHRGAARVTARCDLDRVLPRLEFGSRVEHRIALAHGYYADPWHDRPVLVDAFDATEQLARVRYYFTGASPDEVVTSGEAPIAPQHAKTRDLAWFGRTLVRERILWVQAAPDLRVSLDGRWTDLGFERRPQEMIRLLPRSVRAHLDQPTQPATDRSRPARWISRFTTRPAAVKQYSNAWVLMDELDRAGDNAEALFRRLRAHHPEINAWFAIDKDSRDWHRLRHEFGSRVVAHGSSTWHEVMAHCTELLSSHADAEIIRPPTVVEVAEPRWRFTFLQHGVSTRDLHLALADRPIDLFVTSTPEEYASIADDGTAYPFTTKEVRLTGLPRFDALLDAAARTEQRNLVLVSPTWRRWLAQRPVGDSEFARHWSALLTSPELAADCGRLGLTLALLPHPALDPLVERLHLPDHVQRLRYADGGVADLLARTHLLVTDYASTAFDAAYLDRPVVYFQFDADVMLHGGHVGRQGWFDARRDGFGPVVDSVPTAIDAIRTALVDGLVPPYADRVAAAFPQRDGNCGERVIAAVRGHDA